MFVITICRKFTTSRSAQCVSELYPGEDLRRKCGEGCKLLKSRQSDEVLSQASKSDPSDSGFISSVSN